MHRFIDLSHPIEDGMITYRGLPGPIISDHLSREVSAEHYADGTTFQIGKIEMVANTGTYIDAPFHRFSKAGDLSDFELAAIAHLDGLVLHADPQTRAIHQDLFKDYDLSGKAVLVHTGWDQHWRTDHYFEDHPFLTRDAAEYLSASMVALVGIDSLNIDDTEDGTRPVHTILLGTGIPIVEHLCNLEALPASRFKFFAVPAPVKGMGSFPVRAFAMVD
ncbi:MAG: cyclase family protein [Deltaproteobacteria bacterium]|jgi:kynurenine formamidase|nr:cyclase family protein [Deltaproteobacteria bacterium]